MHKSLPFLAALAFAAPLGTIAAQGGMAGMDHDATAAVKGSGKLPDGWMLRYDPPRGNAPVPGLDAVNFVTMGSGFHFTSGPAAIYYNTKDMGNGEYAVTATFAQRKSMGHEAYGIFIGGRDLQGPNQTYTYLEVKPCRSSGDCKTAGAPLGEVLISQRTSDGKPVSLLATAHNDAVHPDDPADGHATNTLKIHVAKDAVHFYVNDKMVAEIPKSKIGDTNGLAGIRINHNSDVHVTWMGVTK